MTLLKFDPQKLSILVIAFVPPLLVLAFVATHALGIPIGDQWWDTVHVAVKAKTNQLVFGDYFALAEGHRPAVIRLITVYSAWFFNLSPILMSFTTWIFSFLNLCLVFALYWGDDLSVSRAGRSGWPMALACFSAVIFVIHDDQAWLDYYFSTWQISLFAYLCAAILLQRLSGWLAVLAAIFFAIVSSLGLGIGLASWIALPVMALGFKKYRNPLYALFWLCCASLFVYAYSSSWFDPLSQAGRSQKLSGLAYVFDGGLIQGLAAIVLKVPLLSMARLWLPANAGMGQDFDIIVILFTAACVLIFGYLITMLLVRRSYQSAFTWLGLASFSFLGSWLVFISRRKYMPDPRHGAGAVAFWLGCAALLVGSLYSPSLKSSRRVVSRWLAKSMLAMIVLVSTVRDVFAFSVPSRITQKCESVTRHYFKERSSSLRSCFWYVDERSYYQLSLLGLAGLGESRLGFPRIENGVLTVSVLPGKLLTALLATDASADRGARNNFFDVSYSTQDEDLPGFLPSPYHRGMDWSGQGVFYRPSSFSSTQQALMEVLRSRLGNYHDLLVLYSSSETTFSATEVQGWLRSNGWSEIDEFRLPSSMISRQRHYLRAQCFQRDKIQIEAKRQNSIPNSSCWRSQ